MTDSENINTQITDDPFASVRIAEFRYLMLGRFLFVMALRMTTTVVGWWIYKLTKDPFAIGMIGLSEVFPALSLALYSGHRVDVADKRKIILTTVSGFFALAIILYYLSGAHAAVLFPHKQIALFIYGVFFVNGILRSFTGPAMGAMIAFIVPKNLLQNATVWSQGTFLSASVMGHAIGGFSIALIGINNTFLLISGIILACLFSFRQLKPKPPQVTVGDQSTWQSVLEGLVFVYKTRALFGAMALDMFAVLFGGAVAMIPVYASDILKVGPLGFGWLNAATDIGAITIVILLTFFPMKRAQGRKMLLAVGGFGVCIILFGLSKWFWLSFSVLLISGMLDGISVVVRGTVMQLLTPDPMRGRVSSVSGMFILSSNELGQFESGLASRIFGVIPSVVFGGFMTLSVVITTWFKASSLRKFEY